VIAQWYSTGLRAGWSAVRFPAGGGNFSYHHHIQTGSGAHPAATPAVNRDSFRWGQSLRGVKLNTHLYLVPKSTMRRAVSPLPNTPSWRGAQKAQGELYLSLTPWCRILFEKLNVTQLIKKYPAVLWNPKVHYRVHTSPPLDPILSQPNPVSSIDPYLPKIHLNVILPPTPRSSQWSLAFGPPNQNPVNTSPLPQACHMSSPPHHPWFNHLNIRWRIQAVKFIIMQFSSRSVFLSFRSKYLPQHVVLKNPNNFTCYLCLNTTPLRRILYLVKHHARKTYWEMEV
jgi:hypothetical protein